MMRFNIELYNGADLIAVQTGPADHKHAFDLGIPLEICGNSGKAIAGWELKPILVDISSNNSGEKK